MSIDIFENLRHSTKKELRCLDDSDRKLRPPKLSGKKPLNRRLFSSRPISLMNEENNESNLSELSRSYDESLNISYFDFCFEFLEKLGEGSFGECHKVRCKQDGRLYAIKKSKEAFRNSGDRREKISEVGRYLKIPQHENIISLVNAWEQDDFVYLQMELGIISLDQYVMDHPQISEVQLWNILLDMLLALKNLHDSNLIHLDVKLENIIVCDYGLCKLSDFGLLMDVQGAVQTRNEGDARYMAGELLEGRFSKAADVFSLGISMLELASDLKLPSHGQLWHNLRKCAFPKHIVKNVPRELLNIIRRMMVKDYKKRPSVKSLLKHPRLKRMLKQRRDAASAGKGVSLDGRLTALARTSTPLLQTPPSCSNYNSNHQNQSCNDDLSTTSVSNSSQIPKMNLIESTPPMRYNTPNLSAIFNSCNSSINLSSNKTEDQTTNRSTDDFELVIDMDRSALSPLAFQIGSTPVLHRQAPQHLSPIPTTNLYSARKMAYLNSSAKKLDFLAREND